MEPTSRPTWVQELQDVGEDTGRIGALLAIFPQKSSLYGTNRVFGSRLGLRMEEGGRHTDARGLETPKNGPPTAIGGLGRRQGNSVPPVLRPALGRPADGVVAGGARGRALRSGSPHRDGRIGRRSVVDPRLQSTRRAHKPLGGIPTAGRLPTNRLVPFLKAGVREGRNASQALVMPLRR